jgi:hypothetical protein
MKNRFLNKTVQASVLALTAATAPLVSAQTLESIPSSIPINNMPTKGIPFVPLNYSDLIDPSTGAAVNENDIVLLEEKGDLVPYLASDVLDILNSKEKKLNEIGISLRNGMPTLEINQVVNPEVWLRNKAADAGIDLNKMVENYQTGLDNCQDLDVTMLGTNPQTGKAYQLSDRVPFAKEFALPVKDLIPRLNEQQKHFCALGWSLFEGLGGQDVLSQIMQKRDELMDRFAIPLDHPIFGMAAWIQSFDLDEIENRVKAVQDALKNPSPTKIYALALANKDVLPAALQLPEIPRIEQPQLQRRLDLKLQKRYEWPGFSEGDAKIFKVYGNAWAELRSGRVQDATGAASNEQVLQGEAKAGAFVLSQDVPIVKGMLDSQLSSSQAYATLTFCYLDNCTKKEGGLKDVGFSEGDPEAFLKNWERDYEQQLMVGPIPVVVRAGVGLYGQVGWNLNANLMGVNGEAVATGKATAKGEAAVGIQDFVEAGAGGEVVVISDQLRIAGNANIELKGNGYPVIQGQLIGENKIRALDGRIYAYALIDVLGPLGEYADQIVETIKDLGPQAEGLIRRLGDVSGAAKKYINHWDNEAKKLADSLSKATRKIGKKLKFSTAPVLAGQPYGLSINGTRVRYEHDWVTFPGIEKVHRFLNYKLMVGPDGQKFEGNAGDFNGDAAKIFEENLTLKAYEEALAAAEASAESQEAEFFKVVSGYVRSDESRSLGPLADTIESQFTQLETKRSNIIGKIIAD